MSEDKNNEVFKLIDAFVDNLLALNSGKPIPLHWKGYLLKAIRPKPQKRGVKPDYDEVTQVVKSLALAGNKVRLIRTKHQNAAVMKDLIAKQHQISRKTVERIDELRPEFVSELSILNDLDPEKRKAYIDGLLAAISEKWDE